MVMFNAPSPMMMNTLLSNPLQMAASGMVTGYRRDPVPCPREPAPVTQQEYSERRRNATPSFAPGA
jgi:hypothetical protein